MSTTTVRRLKYIRIEGLRGRQEAASHCNTQEEETLSFIGVN